MTLAETILTSIGTTGFIGLAAYGLLKHTVILSLQLDVDKRINTHKAELDRVRDDFQFQINQAMLSLQKQNEKIHEIYPELYERLRISEGLAVSILGIKMVNTWEEHSPDDIRKVMERKNFPSGLVEDLYKQICQDRPKGIAEMRKHFDAWEIQQAEFKLIETKNYVTSKSLYMTEEITDECYEACKAIWSAIVDANPDHRDLKGYKANLKLVETHLESIKAKMKAELNRKLVNS